MHYYRHVPFNFTGSQRFGVFRLAGFKEFALSCQIDGLPGNQLNIGIIYNNTQLLTEPVVIGTLVPIMFAKVFPVYAPDVEIALQSVNPADWHAGFVRIYAACCSGRHRGTTRWPKGPGI